MKRLIFTLVLLATFLATASTAIAVGPVYVDINAPGPMHDGTSWKTAFTSIQQGVNIAFVGQEVWVAKGTYVENVVMKSGVAFYGGFDGAETQRDQRDFKNNVTVIDGNKEGSVVSLSDCDSSTRIDGFTITNGSGTYMLNPWNQSYGYYGGGIFCWYGAPTITNNVISDNGAPSVGGIYCHKSAANITNNIVARNSSTGIADSDGSVLITNNTIVENDWGIANGKNAHTQIFNNIIAFNREFGYRQSAPRSTGNNNFFGNKYNYSNNNDPIDGLPSPTDISANPLFVDRTNGNYHLKPNSPCIDSGDRSYVYGSVDIDNQSRVQGYSIDIGADEFAPDSIAPITTVTLVGKTGDNGWCTTDVEFILCSEDELSGVDRVEYCIDGINWKTYTSPCTITDEGITTIRYRAADCAGNIEATQEKVIMIDKTAPEPSAEPSGNQGEDGWYISDVDLALSSIDAISGMEKIEYSFDGGITSIPYSKSIVINLEGTSTVCFHSIDKAGNVSGCKKIIIRIDKFAPISSIGLEGRMGDNGWYTSDVVLSLASVDTVSGVAVIEYSLDGITWKTYTNPYTITAEGETTVYYRAIDKAGNIETARQQVIKIDKTAPQIVINSPVDQKEYLLGEEVTADWHASDAGSGVLSATATVPNGGQVDTTKPGEHTFKVEATDIAGNKAEKTVIYYVRYALEEPFTSIKDGKTFKLGSTILVKFALKGASGNFISDASAKAYVISPSGDVSEAVSTSNAVKDNSFRYDTDDEQYIFNLSTRGLSKGVSQIRIDLDDGTSKLVDVSLR